jgi:tripeptide aminopeptidase
MEINRKRMVDEFITLVSMDSLSYQEKTVADYLKYELTSLGFEVTEDEAGSYYGGNANNLYAILEGTIPGEPLLFSAHMDTVAPGLNKKVVMHEDGKITSDGLTVLGADDFAGVVAILEAIRFLRENDIAHRTIEVLFFIAEEVYLKGSEVFDFSIVKATQAYVLDLSGNIGDAALKAPTVISFTAKFTGKASHAGFAPEKGIHAIAMAAQAITKMQLGFVDSDTSVNVGIIEGGLASNIVPEQCSIYGEVRSFNHKKAIDKMEKITASYQEVAIQFGGKVEVVMSFGSIAYEVLATHPVVIRYCAVVQRLGYQVSLTKTFGGSDNNNFMLHNITGIVLACGMHQVHSCEEYTTVEDLAGITSIVRELMMSEV